VPNLASAIVDGNEAAAARGDTEGHINLAGFLVRGAALGAPSQPQQSCLCVAGGLA
jgi:hypothetical protein